MRAQYVRGVSTASAQNINRISDPNNFFTLNLIFEIISYFDSCTLNNFKLT